MTKKMYIKIESLTDLDKIMAIDLTVSSLQRAILEFCRISQNDPVTFSEYDEQLIIISDNDNEHNDNEHNDNEHNEHNEHNNNFVCINRSQLRGEIDKNLAAVKMSPDLHVGDLVQYVYKTKTLVGIVICWCRLPDYVYVMDITQRNNKNGYCGLVKITRSQLLNNPVLTYVNPTDNSTAQRLIYRLRSYCHKLDFFNMTDDYVTSITDGRFTNNRIVEIMSTFGFNTVRGGEWTNALVSFYYGEFLQSIEGE